MADKIGRPRKYANEEELSKAIEEYFNSRPEIESENENINMTYEEYLSKIEDSDGY